MARPNAMSTQQGEVRQLKEGRYVVIDEEPCKIISITTSKPGKHGASKARIDAVGMFDGVKRSMVAPVTVGLSGCGEVSNGHVKRLAISVRSRVATQLDALTRP